MKVSTDFSDGNFSMIEARVRDEGESDENWAWYTNGLVEIPDEEYRRYLLYLDQCHVWHNRIKDLDNKAYDQREALDKAPVDR